MSEQDDPLLALNIGGQSIGVNLDRAIERGDITRRDDGTLAIRERQGASELSGADDGYIGKTGTFRKPCGFLNGFLFEHAYAQAAVPFACRNCYKIKVAPGSLRQLMAVKALAEATGHSTKSGAEVDNPGNQQLYGTYLYFLGLDKAREVYKPLRESIDRQENLGPGVAVSIKRGCTNYERKCGPSDRYTFDPRLDAVERYLFRRFAPSPAPKLPQEHLDAMRFLRMIATAYRIGDETYRDFTGGKPLYPPIVTYSPEEDGAERAPDRA
jgi:hypothetical protein